MKIMISRAFAAVAGALTMMAFAASAAEMPSRAAITAKSASPVQFKASFAAASTTVALAAPVAEKSVSAATSGANQPLRIGSVRALPKAAALEKWMPVEDGFVTRAMASSEGAMGIRVRLDLSGVTAPIEVRAQGSDGRVELMRVDPAQRTEAWTPWTDGSEQAIEVFSTSPLDAGAVRIGAVVHFDESPFAKAAASCTISTSCSTNDLSLDAAMAERKKSTAKMTFVDGSGAFLCTGTLINTERFPSPFFMTAHHCIDNQQAAASLTTLWFYEDLSCGNSLPNPAAEQLTGGAELVMTNYNLDATLLKLNDLPPAGAVYSGWNNARLTASMPVFSISHPTGATSRWASGTFQDDDGRWEGAVQQFNVVRFNRGFIEGGSSGSGLYTLSGGSFQFRGTLLGHVDSASSPYSCTNLNADLVYGRFDIFEPQIRQYITFAGQAADDAPNRARDLFLSVVPDPNGLDRPLNERSDTVRLDNRRIDYVGDIDVYRIRVSATAWVSAWDESGQDTIGMILDSRGVPIAANDDWQVGEPYNFGITYLLTPGTYYLQVAHFEATGTGTYNLRLRADTVDTNYTALWWNANESGWGLNISHQGNTLFGTLYTYDANGNPAWYSMSSGAKQADGSYLGELVTSSGPGFSSTPWNPNAVTRTVVGNMRVSFTDPGHGTLTYNVGPAQVTKTITKIDFGGAQECSWDASNRSRSNNFTDLWWGGIAESGWGVNLAHQGGIIFATLFTYDASGQPRWFVMSAGRETGDATFSGALYRTRGPAFNAVPFTPITAADNTEVGTMTFNFTDGDTGTMTYTVNGVQVVKNIKRFEFGTVKPLCTQFQ